ncbi:MAG TPA: hypothetical protein VGI92_11765 [Gemmatimonadales bacterium]|jgi:negative regulator of sigma E activity
MFGFASLVFAVQVAAAVPHDGREVLALMHQRGRIYHTLTFVQTTRQPGRPDQTWYESIQPAGMLRIDVAPLDSQRTVIYRNDSVYGFRHGQPLRRTALVLPIIVLYCDVFVAPVDSTIGRLVAKGFDLSKLHEDRYQGRKVWVVGADPGDTTRSQFWVDEERLHAVRVMERDSAGNITDSQVLQHTEIDGLWVETNLVFYRNGTEFQREEYHNVRVNTDLEPSVFDPDHYQQPAWTRSAGR